MAHLRASAALDIAFLSAEEPPGFIAGGVGVAAGVTLFVLSNKKEQPAAATVEPYLSLGGLGVRGSF